MERLVAIIADGKTLRARHGATVLQTLKENGIDIPSLCYHPSLGGRGSCGLCMVEIRGTDGWQARHACLMLVEDALQIRTSSQNLKRLRSWAAQTLLRRQPFLGFETEELLNSLIQEKLVDEHKKGELSENIKALSYVLTEGCILCGLCVRMCNKIGRNRLTFLGKGKNLRIGLVPGKDNILSCGNCRACCNICPTGFITPNAEHVFKSRPHND